MSAFGVSGRILSGPATFPDLIALTISVFLGRLVLMSRSLLSGGMIGGTDGAGRLSVSLKYSAHRALCGFPLRMMFPSLLFAGRLGLLFLLESVLVISYRRFMFRWPAALSAFAVSSSMYVFFVLSHTSFHLLVFLPVLCLKFVFLSLVFLVPLLVMSVQVSVESHSVLPGFFAQNCFAGSCPNLSKAV